MKVPRSPRSEVDSEVRMALSRIDWEEVGVRLTAYAVWRARNFQWRTGSNWSLASGKTPEDIASEAVLKVFEGARAWDPARGALLPYLQGVVDSLMSHLSESVDNTLLQNGPTPAAQSIDASAQSEPDPLADLRLNLSNRNDRDLLAVLDTDQTSGAKPSALAAQLGVPVNEINNRLKRLRRIALKINSSGSRGSDD